MPFEEIVTELVLTVLPFNAISLPFDTLIENGCPTNAKSYVSPEIDNSPVPSTVI